MYIYIYIYIHLSIGDKLWRPPEALDEAHAYLSPISRSYIHIYVCVYIYICIYMYMYTYNTHTHTHSLSLSLSLSLSHTHTHTHTQGTYWQFFFLNSTDGARGGLSLYQVKYSYFTTTTQVLYYCYFTAENVPYLSI